MQGHKISEAFEETRKCQLLFWSLQGAECLSEVLQLWSSPCQGFAAACHAIRAQFSNPFQVPTFTRKTSVSKYDDRNDNVCTREAVNIITQSGAAGMYSPVAKSKNISLCGEITKVGTLVADTCRIIYRLEPTSEMPLVAAILNFKMATIFDIFLPTTSKLRQI